MLTVENVARHFRLAPATVRRKIRVGELRANRINRDYRINWEDVWSCERGPMPGRGTLERYQLPLIDKVQLAGGLEVSIRTVERWLAEGLPTRNVFGSVRMNPVDVRDWLALRLGLDLPLKVIIGN
ncbi:helix-turn-helix domain-containing protein [Thioclava sp. ES.031]|uniref:helix-turn-helix domain-containing protein n=1 Tax=Thioclava sp. ES.031 TaxID=1798203 RepID=UPI000BF2FBC1|nr:helix-turn-helix domain-containing protein [Thioclava sp. ES.031]